MTDHDTAHDADAQDTPPDEPGLESEGIGPLGLIIGGAEGLGEGAIEVAEHVGLAYAGEKLVDGAEAVIDYFEGPAAEAPPAIDLPSDER